MFCPQCGQQQATGVIRFCSRCGFPLDGVIQLLGSGGIMPVYRLPDEPVPVSARRKGVKQGGVLLLSGAVIVPLLGVLASFGNSGFLEVLTAFAAIICFIGGPLRMLYAGIFEEGAPRPVMAYPAHRPMPRSHSFHHLRHNMRCHCPPRACPAVGGRGRTRPSWQPRPALPRTPRDYWRKKIAASNSLSLAQRLKEQIRREGPITFHDWMKAALYDPVGGYYRRADLKRWGREGDYRTSPERSELFTATFARYFAKLYDELQRPSHWTIVEAGAGSGTFFASV